MRVSILPSSPGAFLCRPPHASVRRVRGRGFFKGESARRWTRGTPRLPRLHLLPSAWTERGELQVVQYKPGMGNIKEVWVGARPRYVLISPACRPSMWLVPTLILFCLPLVWAPCGSYNDGWNSCPSGWYDACITCRYYACRECPPGYYCPDGVNRYPCEAGSYSSNGYNYCGSVDCYYVRILQ